MSHRPSTRDQHPEAQDEALTGVELVFIERPAANSPAGFNSTTPYVVRSGDQLVITKLDRLGRSLEHLIELSNELQQRQVDLVVLDQGIDTSTAAGRMLFQILGPIADSCMPSCPSGPRRPGRRPSRGREGGHEYASTTAIYNGVSDEYRDRLHLRSPETDR